MSDAAASGEIEFTIPQNHREDDPISEAHTRTFTIGIHQDIIDLVESIFEDIQCFICFFLFFPAVEDDRILLVFSTRMLILNWLVCNVLSPLIEVQVPLESESSTIQPSRLSIKLMDFLNATLDSLAGDSFGQDSLSRTSSFREDANSMGSDGPSLIWPSTIVIVGPLTVIMLTCIIADNKYYYLFATLFAPMVDNVVSTTTPNQRIPDDDGETYDGVLWGIVTLFILESLLVGSILVLMTLITLALTTFATLSSSFAPRAFAELLEEMPTLFIGFFLVWATCVLTANILRMVIYQTVGDDD